MKYNIFSTISTPYNIRESVYWLLKRACGLSKKHAGIVRCMPQTCRLNENITPVCRLVFVGDIMPTGSRFVDIGPGLKEFLADADYLIANFEGVITESKSDALALVSDRRHSKQIITMLTRVFTPVKTCLAVSNNHAADFGKDELYKSIAILEEEGFAVFGYQERLFLDINDRLRIVSGTMWSNRPCDYVSWLDKAFDHLKPAACNIFYPHWGYEFELYPRPEMICRGKDLIQKFDAVIGHHSHCPQPVTAEPAEGTSRVLAYSLGDFFSVRKSRKYQYGLALKVDLGQNGAGRWLAARLHWRLTKCSILAGKKVIVDINDEAIFQ